MKHIITPASGLKVGDKNGSMELVQIGSSAHVSKVVLDWQLKSGATYSESVASDTEYMIQRAN